MHNFIIRILSLFIFNRNKRKSFRKKYLKMNKIQVLQRNLENYITRKIDTKTVDILNTFFDVREAKKATGSLRKVQIAGSILLKELKKICDENNLSFWLDYGTLLGAHRNQGFIPWDDDIDVGMMRKDFEKLKKIIVNYPEFKLTEWLHLREGVDVYCRVSKFCFNRNDCHLFVDIFTYDFHTNDNLLNLYNQYVLDKELLRNDLKNLNMPQYSFCECNNPKDLEIIDRTFEKYNSKYYSDDDGNIVLYGIENPYNKARRIFYKETIFPLKTIMFENHIYNIPNDIDHYLTVNFGDYMRIPSDVGHSKHPAYTSDEISTLELIINSYK